MDCQKLYQLVLLLICGEGALSTLTLMPAELIVYEGENATFNCSGFPPREPVTLTNENNVRDERISRIEEYETFVTFQLPDVRRSDDGRRFHCLLYDTVSNTSTITVYVPPQLTGPEGTVYILETTGYSQPITFFVTQATPPLSDFTWQVNGTILQGTSRVKLSSSTNSTSLKIESPSRRDSGNYSVFASGLSGSTAADFRLIVMYDEFTEVPRSATLNVGGTFTQKCRHQFGWVYSWHSSRGPLNNGSRSKVLVSSDGRMLTYGPVDGADTGLEVECVVRALDRETFFTSPPATLTVLAPPSISSPAEVTTTEDALAVLLPFSVLSFSGEFDPAYEHNGAMLNVNLGRLRRFENGSLVISNLTREDSGKYTIWATNNQGTSSADIQLRVRYKPEIQQMSINSLVYPVNTNISIPCGDAVVGEPAPNYSWRRCSITTTSPSAPSGMLGGTFNLSLATVGYGDSGIYECTASNVIGEDSILVRVRVLDPPDPPTMIIVKTTDDKDGFFLSWSPPQAEEISGYKLLAYPQPTTYSDNMDEGSGVALRNSACVEVTCRVVERVVNGKDNVQDTLEKLLPAVYYNLSVVTLSHEFQLQSTPSESFIRRTGNGVPGVGSVKALAQGPSSANLSWTLAFSGGSPITKFVIEFRRNDSSAWHPALTVPWNETGDINKMASDISPDIRQTTIFGLEAREFYQFRMAASNRLGMGPFSVTTQAILSNSKGVPSPPSRPVVTGWGPNQVVISTSIPKIGSDSSLRLGVYEILNETKTLRVVELDYQEGEAVTLVWENTSYHGDLSFQVFAVNLFGPSLPSEDSLKARQNIQANSIPSDVGGVVVLSVMLLVNSSTAVAAVIICRAIRWESRKKERSIARRIEIVKDATTPKDCPLSPYSSMFGELRSSPDGRSHVIPALVQTLPSEVVLRSGFPNLKRTYQDNLSPV